MFLHYVTIIRKHERLQHVPMVVNSPFPIDPEVPSSACNMPMKVCHCSVW